jgi:Tropinone reductase 1
MRGIVVTGGSSGIGKACVLSLLRDESLCATIVTCARHHSGLADLRDEVRFELGDAFADSRLVTVAADVTCPEGRRSLAETCEQFDAIDGAVLQSGTNLRKPSEQYSVDEYDHLMGSNCSAHFFCAVMLKPLLLKSDSPSIVLMSSIAADSALGTGSVYAMAKAGIKQLATYLATEWHPIRVNAVSPGFVVTSLTQHRLHDEALHSNITSRTPLGRVGHPSEIAEPILFLLSNKASFITGQALTIDGGLTCSCF